MPSDATHRAAVLGAGSWGTALAVHLGSIGHDVTLWGRDADAARARWPRVAPIPTYLPDVTFPAAVRPTPLARRRARRRASTSSSRCRRTGCAPVVRAAAPHHSAGAVLVSATKGLETDTLARMSEVMTEETRRPRIRSSCCPGRASPPKWRGGCRRRSSRPRPISDAVRPVQEEFRGPFFRLYGSDDVVGVEDRRGAEEHHRDRRRRRRVARARAQRAGGAHHARPGGDLAAGVRDGRPPRDARRSERARRSRADVHGVAQPQSPRRHRARPRADRSTRFSPACGWWPRA